MSIKDDNLLQNNLIKTWKNPGNKARHKQSVSH